MLFRSRDMEIVGKYNLYRKIEAERVTASGIIIPDTVVIPSSRYECVGDEKSVIFGWLKGYEGLKRNSYCKFPYRCYRNH